MASAQIAIFDGVQGKNGRCARLGTAKEEDRQMRRRFGFGALASLALVGGLAGDAQAAPGLRVQVDQRGDFVLLGNALAYECNNPVAPIVGTVGACGTVGLTDSAPDVYWRADSPMVGQAEANTSIAVANARTTAMLVIPAGAAVTHAYLYWAAGASQAQPDTLVTLDREGGLQRRRDSDTVVRNQRHISVGGGRHGDRAGQRPGRLSCGRRQRAGARECQRFD